jgi:hypothetical protein
MDLTKKRHLMFVQLFLSVFTTGITYAWSVIALGIHEYHGWAMTDITLGYSLMARYEREGGREILELIRMQADRGRQLYRDAMRGRAEQRSLMFVFPMAIDLIVVMATVILPAVTQMGFLS